MVKSPMKKIVDNAMAYAYDEHDPDFPVVEKSIQEDNRVMFPNNIKMGLIRYAYEERKLQDNPLIRDMITWKSLTNRIIKMELMKRGYYIEAKK